MSRTELVGGSKWCGRWWANGSRRVKESGQHAYFSRSVFCELRQAIEVIISSHLSRISNFYLLNDIGQKITYCQICAFSLTSFYNCAYLRIYCLGTLSLLNCSKTAVHCATKIYHIFKCRNLTCNKICRCTL